MKYVALIGILVFGIIIWQTDFHAVGNILLAADLGLLGLCVALLVPTFYLKVLRWRVLLRLTGIDLSLRRCATLYLGSMFVASATPGRAGELAKVYFVHKEKEVPVGRALTSTIVDRLMEVIVLFFLGVVGALLMTAGMQNLLYPVLGFSVALGIVILLMLNRRLVDLAVAVMRKTGLLRKFQSGLASDIDQFYGAMQDLRRPGLIMPVLYTFVSMFFFLLNCVLFGRALGIDIASRSVVIIVSIAKLVALIPVTVAGLGTREGTFLYLFGLAGVGRDQVMSFSFLYIFMFNILVNLAGGVAWLYSPIRRTKSEA
ncbi:MAG: lysylphosphatidylglycerol synthase transmembrane domain-containing protein [Acidobacteriota bacterium]